mmetsp:Transcript_19340/g.13996  ORF Transcript_19340/g.13996 Transcript_19340/m.13996 type:complete len:165 (+) Transcript_19340:559-1053(+)
MGPSAAGSVYNPALTDFIFMVNESSYMFVTGPEVIKAVLNEDISKEELGGAKVHTSKSGVAHNRFENDIEAISSTRKLLSFLPQSCRGPREVKPWTEEDRRRQASTKVLNNLVPSDPNKPYDVKIAIRNIVDRADFFEIMPEYARNIVVGFGEVEGRTVGICAN